MSRTSESSPSDTITPTSSPCTRSPAPAQISQNEEVNLEYLRNVILQFLEHKEMRVSKKKYQFHILLIFCPFQPNLIRVLSIILHFTPQETRRLIAKV